MSFIVQKYGGTSVGNPERIRNVALRVAESRKEGHRIVVVVSAMSGVTDHLIKLARDVTTQPNNREMDMLLATREQQTNALGAKVMQARSVEFAKKFKVKFEVRSSFNHNPGTLIREEHAAMEDVVVRGVSLEKNQAKVTIIGVPDKPGVAAGLFSALAESGTNVDMIVQNVSLDGHTDLTFTLNKDELPAALIVIDTQVEKI